jgi:hypothetical protein
MVMAFERLGPGWDGHEGASPVRNSIRDAVDFAYLAGHLASNLEPTIVADGSVVFEIGDGEQGSFRFPGDGTVVYSIAGMKPGATPIEGPHILPIMESVTRT